MNTWVIRRTTGGRGRLLATVRGRRDTWHLQADRVDGPVTGITACGLWLVEDEYHPLTTADKPDETGAACAKCVALAETLP